MIETFTNYATESTGRLVLLIVSAILAILAWIKIVRTDMHVILKVLSFPIPVIPIKGSDTFFWQEKQQYLRFPA